MATSFTDSDELVQPKRPFMDWLFKPRNTKAPPPPPPKPPPSPTDTAKDIADKKAAGIKKTLAPYQQDLRNLFGQVPQAPDYSGVLGGLRGLQEQVGAGPDVAGAEEYAARQAGFPDVASYRASLQQGATATLEGQQGLPPEQRALLERQNRAIAREMAEAQSRQVESILANTGSFNRAMASADEHAQSIADTRLRGEIMILNEDFARKIAQFEAQQGQYQTMLTAGQAAAGQFLQAKSQVVGNALAAYMAEAQTLQASYQGEVAALQTQAQLILDSAYLAMGVEDAANKQWQSAYDQYMKPILDDLIIKSQQRDMQFGFDDVLAIGAVIFGGILGFALGGPGGAMVGIGVGGGVGDIFRGA